MALSDMWQVFDVSGNITLTLAVATVAFVIYFIYVNFRTVDNWEKYGVKSGTLGKEAFQDFRLACQKLQEKHGDTVGFNNGGMFLITTNLELLKSIMVKDFNTFPDRDLRNLLTSSHLNKSLFFLKYRDWKRIRQVISPCFSTGKIKSLLSPVNDSAKKISQVIEDYAKRDELVPIKHLAGQFSSEVIARLAFGIRTDCIGKEDDEFTLFSKSITKDRSKLARLLMLIMCRFPNLHKFLVHTLKINFFDEVDTAVDVYFTNILLRTIAERKEHVRLGKKLHQDFLQSLIIAKEEGDRAAAAATTSAFLSMEETDDDKTTNTMTDEELIAQAMLIVFGGFETTATTLQFATYLVAKHPDIQEKVYGEIQRKVSSDVPTYEELGELKYMDQVINETIRLFPPAPITTRRAMETATHGNVTIPKGTAVIIPLCDILMDPKHYEDPEVFDPDRFTAENKAKRDPMAFPPFGYGPRLCIGVRLAFLELKLGLVNLIRKVKFELNESTQPPVGGELNLKFQIVVVVEKPIMLSARLRK